MYFSFRFPSTIDFRHFAQIENIENRMFLIYNGERFFEDGHNGKGRRYWRCRRTTGFACKARMVTNLVNGYEMMKIQNGVHDHVTRKAKKKRRETTVSKK